MREALPGLEQSADPAALQLAAAPLLRSVILLGQERLPGLLAKDFARLAEAVGEADLDRLRGGVALRDAAIMMYTSGTTARPKGCRLCHEAVVRSAAGMQRRLAIGEHDRMWNPLPLFHMAAVLPLLATVVAGGCFISDTFFDADQRSAGCISSSRAFSIRPFRRSWPMW